MCLFCSGGDLSANDQTAEIDAFKSASRYLDDLHLLGTYLDCQTSPIGLSVK